MDGECLALKQTPASLSGHGLATVPCTCPAWAWQVNVSLFLSVSPRGGCSFRSDEQMYLHSPSRWGPGLIFLKFTFPASESRPPRGWAAGDHRLILPK